MLTVMDLAQLDTHLHKASYREFAGSCPNPKCHCRRDGFRVQPDRHMDKDGIARGGFMCRGCWDPRCPPIRPDQPRWGDPIDYLRHFKRMSYAQARAYLAEQEGEREPVQQKKSSQPDMLTYQSEDWQKAAHQIVQNCMARLWSPIDPLALDYARSRGLSDELIRRVRLGYSLKDDIPRLIIPFLANGLYVAISSRDLRLDIPKEKRWQDVAGGTKSEFYLADCLKTPRPTVVLEAPLDALSVVQTCGDLVNIVATGGTNGARTKKNLIKLAQQDLVLLAFDADEAGDKEARWWLDHLSNARRLRPIQHDVNDMLVQGWDIRQWIIDALQEAEYTVELLYPSDQKIDDNKREAIPYEQEQLKEHIVPSQDTKHSLDERSSILDDPLFASCTFTFQSDGYTIADRAREILQEEAQRRKERLMRNAIRNVQSRAIYLLRGVEIVEYPLNYPDPDGMFYGYDTIRVPDWYAPGTKRGLKELLYGVSLLANALVHMHEQRFVTVKQFGIILYRNYINDEWMQDLDTLYTYIKWRWNYLVPEQMTDQYLLRYLCRRTLAFENHFLVCYRTYLLSLLSSKDRESQNFALEQLGKVLYPDDEVRAALQEASDYQAKADQNFYFQY